MKFLVAVSFLLPLLLIAILFSSMVFGMLEQLLTIDCRVRILSYLYIRLYYVRTFDIFPRLPQLLLLDYKTISFIQCINHEGNCCWLKIKVLCL